jgi:5-methylcytosine-specific restriction protein B
MQRENHTPRLLAAAKEFNIGKGNLLEFLTSKGFQVVDSPAFKLSSEMYLALKDEFSEVSNESHYSSSPQPDQFRLKVEKRPRHGIVEEIVTLEKTKIRFLKYEGVDEQGILVEKPDPTRWTYAYKEYWPEHKFELNERIEFLVREVTVYGKLVKAAVPPDPILDVEKKEEGYETTGENTSFQALPAGNTNFTPTKSVDHTGSSVVDKRLRENHEKEFPEGNSIQQIITTAVTINSTIPKVNFMQKILFGSPGTGKSHTIDGADNSYLKQLGIINKSDDCIKTVFHPEYTYGDFMGKLMPYTNDDGLVEYRFYAGHFLKAIARAYKNIIISKIEHERLRDEAEKSYKREIGKVNKKEFSDGENAELQRRREMIAQPRSQNVALVVDEINRGNSAAIFGTTFQLLDRDEKGWSSYHVKISDLENNELLKEISLEYKEYKKSGRIDKEYYGFDNKECSENEYNRYLDYIFEDLDENERISLSRRDIKIPANLSIIATMNTSDNSIYFMDSAFKRRWDWEFIDITSDDQKRSQAGRILEDGFSWVDFVDNINEFIKRHGDRIRKIEDKQIGYYFIKGDVVTHDAVKNKLMFFLWDSIFNNDKKPLKELIGADKTLITFGDFIRNYAFFINAIENKTFAISNVL